MSNIPNYEQWGQLNDYLNSIAVSLGSQVDTSTWAGVQKAVRMGLAPDLFPVGTQLKVNHSVYGERLYDVIAHDHFESADDSNAHTMTLICHDAIVSLPFDASEAFYYAEKELPAGTYNFTLPTGLGKWSQGTYQFTLTQAVPQGGRLAINGNATTDITACKLASYASPSDTSQIVNVNITSGNGGTSLGKFGDELNIIDRVSYGSDNYKESPIRQFLNSELAAGSMWTPQTKYDRISVWMRTNDGFLRGLDDDFVSVIGKVIVPCAANKSYESVDSSVTVGSKYILEDKFYLLSQKEIFDSAYEIVDDDSSVIDYYKQSSAEERIKYLDGAAIAWTLRSAYHNNSSSYKRVVTTGTFGAQYAVYSSGICPVCNIV